MALAFTQNSGFGDFGADGGLDFSMFTGSFREDDLSPAPTGGIGLGDFWVEVYQVRAAFEDVVLPATDFVIVTDSSGARFQWAGRDIESDEAGNLTDGTVTGLQYRSGSTVSLLAGASIDLAALRAASLTATLDDDRALFEAEFGGNDFLLGSNQRDIIRGFGGSDLIAANDGNDRLFGDAGNDLLIGGFGADRLSGGGGRDLLIGNEGADVLTGGGGNDTLDGGLGSDTLSGGGGNDWFVVRPGDGAALILDFQPGSDRICIEGPARFGDLTITRSGSDARIAYEDLVIVVEDIRPGQLKAAMFDFAEGITVDRFEAFTTGFDFMA